MGPFLLSFACALSIALQSEADDAYAYIAGLADKGMNELVVREATAFVRDHPEHAKARHARYRLASALFELGRRAEARPLFEDVSRDRAFEFAAEANLRFGQCALADGDAAKAEAAFTRALEWGREYLASSARSLRAESRFAQKNWKGAREDWSGMLAKPATQEAATDAQIGIAWCLYREGKPAESAARVKALFETRAVPASRDGELHCLLGEACLDVHEAQTALESFRAVREPTLADAAARGAGYALAALGDHRGAAVEFARAVDANAKGQYAAECALQCGVERLAAGDSAGARAILSKPIAGQGIAALFWRARAEFEGGDAEAALATLAAADSRADTDEWKKRVATLRGSVLDRLGRKDDAARAFEQSGSIAALQSAAALHLENGRADEAAALAQKILDRGATPEQATLAWLALAESRFAQQRWKEAENAFAQATKLDVDPKRAARARLRAAWCRYSSGDAAGACGLFDAAVGAGLEPSELEEASFMRARAAEAGGAHENAVRLYREHAAKFPNGPHVFEATLRLARAGDDENAIAILEALLRAHEDDERADDARFDLAERLSNRKQWKEAAQRYAELLAHAPNSPLAPRARYGLAWCAYSLGDGVTAAREITPLAADGSVDSDLRAAAFELRVWIALQSQDGSGAVRAWRDVATSSLALAKKTALARAVVERLRTEKRTDEALAVVADLERASADRPNLARVGALRARLELDRARLDEATSEIARAVERARGDEAAELAVSEVAFALGEARFEARDDARALAAYALVGAKSPFHDRALYKRGFTCLRAGDAASAAREFGRLVDEHAESALFHEALFLRGEALYRSERLEEALACFTRVRQEAPRHEVMPKVLFRAGLVCARLERWREAADTLSLLARTKPDFENLDEAELWRGRALAALGDTRAARSAFDRVIQHDKGALGDRARIEIGRASVAAGDLEGALSSFLKTAVLSGDSDAVAEALWNAGDVLERLGQADRAAQQYREIVEQHAASSFAARAKEKLARARAVPATAPKRRA